MNIGLQKEAVDKGQIKIDTSYKYFCHDFNLFRKGHPELVQEIRKVRPVYKMLQTKFIVHLRWLDTVFQGQYLSSLSMLRRHKQRFVQIATTVVLDKDENLL